jgi:hypothetical protein
MGIEGATTMEINLSKGIQLPTLPGAKGADFPVIQKPQSTPQTKPQTSGSYESVEVVEDIRFQQVKAAAESYFKDVFAVSDMRFTIYKDTSGQYITRYTSLRDGKVTYIPEPALLQSQRARRQDALISLKV